MPTLTYNNQTSDPVILNVRDFNGDVIDFTQATRFVAVFTGNDSANTITIDTDITAGSITGDASGNITFNFIDVTVNEDLYAVDLIVYDPNHTNGQKISDPCCGPYLCIKVCGPPNQANLFDNFVLENFSPLNYIIADEPSTESTFTDFGSLELDFGRAGSPNTTPGNADGFIIQCLTPGEGYMSRNSSDTLTGDLNQILSDLSSGTGFTIFFLVSLDSAGTYPVMHSVMIRSAGSIFGYVLSLSQTLIEYRIGPQTPNNTYSYAQATIPSLSLGDLHFVAMRITNSLIVDFFVDGTVYSASHFTRGTQVFFPPPVPVSALLPLIMQDNIEPADLGRGTQVGLTGHGFPTGVLDGKMGRIGIFDSNLSDSQLNSIYTEFLKVINQ